VIIPVTLLVALALVRILRRSRHTERPPVTTEAAIRA
jgi:hypothetical protein